MPDPRTDKRLKALEAAQTAFSRYGFKRASMDDIAKLAGMSRPALYLLFRNKQDLFRSLSERLQVTALEAAEAALAADKPFVERLHDAILVKEEMLFRVVSDSPHGEELFDANTEIAGDVTERTLARFQQALADAIRDAADALEIDTGRVGLPPERLAALLLAGIHGLKMPLPEGHELRRKLTDLVRLFVAALTPPADAERREPISLPSRRVPSGRSSG